MSLIIASGLSLPQEGPLPQAKPPVSAEKPVSPSKSDETDPLDKPGPPWPSQPQNSALVKPPALEDQHLVIAPENEAEYQTCLKDLQSLGVVFKPVPRMDDGQGCGIEKPIVISHILPGIKLVPDATLRCPTARALAQWMRDSVLPTAHIAVPDQGRITAINQATSYMCRLRNNAQTGKISEHARGNAIDIDSFSFEKGDPIAIEPREEDSTLVGAFQRTVSASGCLYFTTVLDPESDAAHEHHFHLDLLRRNSDFRYCH